MFSLIVKQHCLLPYVRLFIGWYRVARMLTQPHLQIHPFKTYFPSTYSVPNSQKVLEFNDE